VEANIHPALPSQLQFEDIPAKHFPGPLDHDFDILPDFALRLGKGLEEIIPLDLRNPAQAGQFQGRKGGFRGPG
jgi:hypothetical protein